MESKISTPHSRLSFIEEEFRKLKEKFPEEFKKTEVILNSEISNDMKLLIIESETLNKEFCLCFLKIFYQNLYYLHSDSKYFEIANMKYTKIETLFN